MTDNEGGAMGQTRAEIQCELQEWYKARRAAAAGQSITIQTSAGSRTLTRQNLSDINAMIDRLERQLSASPVNGRHSWAVASFDHDLDRG